MGSPRTRVGPAAGGSAIDALILCLIAYLLGSIPFAWVLGRARGIDIRRVGSGNIGATNLGRALGRRWAVTAFLLDFLKGLAPVLIAHLWLADTLPERRSLVAVASGASAIVGHVAPVWLGFRGGKGVATTFGALTALAWPATLIAGALWLVLFFTTRTVSIASIAAAVSFPLAVWAVNWGNPLSTWLPVELFALACALLILWRHRSNIARLVRGEEHRFGKKVASSLEETRPPLATRTDRERGAGE